MPLGDIFHPAIAIPLPASVALTDPHVFAGNPRLVAYAAPQSFRRVGDALVAEIPLDQYGEGAKAIGAGALSGILAFGDGLGVRFVAAPGAVPTGGEAVAGPAAAPIPPLWTLILGALAGGLLLNIMPCVFPILSLKALSLARAGESEAKARAEGLAYTAGVVLACVALGGLLLALRAAGEQVGWAFQLQEPGVVIALLVLAAAITANFGGLFELPAISVSMGGERMGAFATGLLAAFPLNTTGFDLLERGEFDAVTLDIALVAGPGEAPAAYYGWAFAATNHDGGRAVMMASVDIHRLLYWAVPTYARAVTADGSRALQRIGFRPHATQAGLFVIAPALSVGART